MEKFIREYEEDGQIMQEWEITTLSGFTHKVRRPTPQELTKEDMLEELKQEYLKSIRDARDLGNDSEVTRLQQEYQIKKIEIESAQ